MSIFRDRHFWLTFALTVLNLLVMHYTIFATCEMDNDIGAYPPDNRLPELCVRRFQEVGLFGVDDIQQLFQPTIMTHEITD